MITTSAPKNSTRNFATNPATVTMPDGSTYKLRKLLASGKTNAKLRKNGKRYMTLGLSMAPHTLGGIGNLCPHASASCKMLCLNLSGRTVGQSPHRDLIMSARIARARLYHQDRELFLAMLHKELTSASRLAKRHKVKLICRLNVLSDVDWPRVHRDLIEAFPNIVFYGYTKIPTAMERFVSGKYPSNYYLTFSRSETNEAQAFDFLSRGANITVVFDTKYSATSKHPLPTTWNGFTVIDGDETDLRFLDPAGVIVGLRAKGLARRAEFQNSGFVVKTH